MNKIVDFNKCTGCGACENICPKHAILMQPDKEGFLYPSINEELCVECGKCLKVCPIIDLKEPIEREPTVWAGYSLCEKIRKQSSSGGIFSLLAEKVIEGGGIVCGVELDENFIVRHSCTNNSDEIKKYNGSKYVQSETKDIFKKVKSYLVEGKEVLFSGTPCQVAGLRSYLGKEYESLICVDCICFGVPSPLVFQKYINSLETIKGKSIKNINFRSKVNGWTGKKFSFEVTYSDDTSESEIITKNLYHRTFFSGLNARNSCYDCSFKTHIKPGDITLADFWGVEELLPDMDDGKGTSLIFLNTQKGEKFLKAIKCRIKYKEITYETAVQYNKAANISLPFHSKRNKFFNKIVKERSGKKIMKIMKKYTKVNFVIRILRFGKRRIIKFLQVFHKIN
ncbi:Coenzyme F420 hydrogenase/dehydrogenase, beta subunit C-terminal domain [Anaerosacchariphilus polymeriproducens]|uniref:4Fe-4S dicluster domain-containing protein n=1 Tax=Anaerosacchariphilus polymeriproducens TaxID=1812858 RepID=A0A371AR45_9FIRM|nr:Coenzyme F420 hydrogenase/dehydrogenase, beta subunit C-terminal domain [Anaerosacchariphilus polymeriproducens]RDU22002.1 4Fe-4S dicluster domain-containing protein [Anaerosacchariphilus polymeriproducens]